MLILRIMHLGFARSDSFKEIIFKIMTRRLFRNLIVFTFFLVFFGCNYEKEKGNERVINMQSAVIQDSATAIVKFDLYCIFAGEKFAFKDDSTHLIDYSSCDLDVNALSHFSDTLELSVNFYQNKKMVNAENCLENGVRRISRILYSLKENKILEYFTPENMGFYEGTPTSRYFKPLQPEVISYIIKKKSTLNLWFKGEAKRRGIIEY